jgi:hypothetical protein
MYTRGPDVETRLLILENLNDEETSGGRHPDLLLDFAEVCGYPTAEVDIEGDTEPADVGYRLGERYASTPELERLAEGACRAIRPVARAIPRCGRSNDSRDRLSATLESSASGTAPQFRIPTPRSPARIQ